MKPRQAPIPVHKLSDRDALGISVHYIDNPLVEEASVMSAHRDDHYIFIFQEGGNTNFMVDFEVRTISGCSVYCVLPGQVHHYISSAQSTGWLLSIATLHVPEQYRRVLEEEVIRLQPLAVAAPQAQHLQRCMDLLCTLVDEREGTFHLPVIRDVAAAFIGLVAGMYSESDSSTLHRDTRVAVITRHFRVLLKEGYRSMKGPAQYAAALHISVSYLNECVSATTGLPVSYWIQQEIILEAKRLLYYSELSVKEVAADLGFEDPTYFSRLFARVAGVPPGQFRRGYRD